MSIVSNVPGQITTVTAPPPSVELALPFQVASDGRLGVITDPVKKAAQHLIDLALTAPGERVMRSSYGVGISQMIFEGSGIETFKAAAQKLQVVYSSNLDSGINNVSVDVIQTAGDVLLFQVSFTLDQDPHVHQALFDFSGHLVGST